MRSPSPSGQPAPLQGPMAEPLPNQPPSPATQPPTVQLKFGRGAQPVNETADCITLSSDDEDEKVKDIAEKGGEKVKEEVDVLEDKKITPKKSPDGKRGRVSSSDESPAKPIMRKKKSKASRLFDTDSSDDENLKQLKAQPIPKSPIQGSLARKVPMSKTDKT